MFLTRFKCLAIVGGLVVIMSACSTVPSSSTTTEVINTLEDNEPLSLNSILPEIEKAQGLDSPEKDQTLLTLAERIDSLENTEADTQNQAISRLLGNINTDQLNIDEYARFATLASRVYLTLDNFDALYNLLYEPRITGELIGFTIDQQIILLEKQAEVNEHFGLINESLLNRIALAELLSDSADITQNNELIWFSINSLKPEQIDTAISDSTNDTLTGWYELAAINQAFDGKPEEKYRNIRLWSQQRPSHPAAIELPIDLQFLQLVFQDKPSQIALLLPLSGRFAGAAGAIRDGFFSGYYSEDADFSRPIVTLYDTNTDDITVLYDRAVAQGANLIIGPLEKSKVSELAQHKLTVPTLALNYTETDIATNASNLNFYQFGLSLEDEAKQIADHAINNNLKYALVIADSNDWSARTAQSFVDRWKSQGGVIVGKREYGKDSNYSDEIKSLLNINDSQSRSTQLKRLFGQSFEFEPRRRNDIDMIFLVARSREGRQIKPILAFHYAGNIPVYATSQLYSSVDDITKTRDLNGIKVLTLPWVINDSPEKQKIQENMRISAGFERLYALGIDAYELHNRLNYLSFSSASNVELGTDYDTSTPKPTIDGATGVLSMDDERRIWRQQPFIEIIKGRAERLAGADTASDTEQP